MRSVSVKQLKEDLSRYLDEVQAGEEMIIKHRNKAVAKIIPFSANGELNLRATKPAAKRTPRTRRAVPPLEDDPLYITDEELEAHVAKLAAEGKIRLPVAPLPPEFWEEPPVGIPAEKLVALVSQDRDED